MKVNTDGVLLAVMADPVMPRTILDIGTGTGVIALIMAQRFSSATIMAVEIDENAASTARRNFSDSVFNSRLQVDHTSIENYFAENDSAKFDLIISNPPFFIGSLKSDDPLKTMARHTDQLFFESLLHNAVLHLEKNGSIDMILPVILSEIAQVLASKAGLYLQKKICISSFADSIPHRHVLSWGLTFQQVEEKDFVIYSRPKEYSAEYRSILKEFFTIF
ncbi:MAG TPA: methyltransferase [Daejeonella sp.]|nr:methyltransferase [Daejeonella sp.]